MKLIRFYLTAYNLKFIVLLVTVMYSTITIINSYQFSSLFIATIIGLYIPMIVSKNQQSQLPTPMHPLIKTLPFSEKVKIIQWIRSYYISTFATLLPTLIIIQIIMFIDLGTFLPLSVVLLYISLGIFLCNLFLVLAPTHIYQEDMSQKKQYLLKGITFIIGIVIMPILYIVALSIDNLLLTLIIITSSILLHLVLAFSIRRSINRHFCYEEL